MFAAYGGKLHDLLSQVTDIGLQQLKGMEKHLESLRLDRTNVTDVGLKNLKGLVELESLDLAGTKAMRMLG
jgi:hypothetical protein